MRTPVAAALDTEREAQRRPQQHGHDTGSFLSAASTGPASKSRSEGGSVASRGGTDTYPRPSLLPATSSASDFDVLRRSVDASASPAPFDKHLSGAHVGAHSAKPPDRRAPPECAWAPRSILQQWEAYTAHPVLLFHWNAACHAINVLICTCVWCVGLATSGNAWYCIVPYGALATLQACGLALDLTLGPAGTNALKRFSHTISPLCFPYACLYPAFRVASLPFGSDVLHFLAVGTLAFTMNTLSLVMMFRKNGGAGSPITWVADVAWGGAKTVVRILDLVTDGFVVNGILQQAHSGACPWSDGAQRCGRIWALGGTQAGLILVQVTFASFVTCLKKHFATGGPRVRRAAIVLYTAQLVVELTMIATTVIYTRNVDTAGAQGRTAREQDLLLTFSVLLTFASFVVNLFGFKRLLRLVRGAAGRMSRVLPASVMHGRHRSRVSGEGRSRANSTAASVLLETRERSRRHTVGGARAVASSLLTELPLGVSDGGGGESACGGAVRGHASI